MSSVPAERALDASPNLSISAKLLEKLSHGKLYTYQVGHPEAIVGRRFSLERILRYYYIESRICWLRDEIFKRVEKYGDGWMDAALGKDEELGEKFDALTDILDVQGKHHCWSICYSTLS